MSVWGLVNWALALYYYYYHYYCYVDRSVCWTELCHSLALFMWRSVCRNGYNSITVIELFLMGSYCQNFNHNQCLTKFILLIKFEQKLYKISFVMQ